jgi:cytochrome-b5 reductase
LSNPEDKTKIKLIFGNVTPADILLREEFDTLKAKHPDRFDVLYVVDKGDKSWKGGCHGVLHPNVQTADSLTVGPTGFITKDLIQKFISPPSKGEKVKVLICGQSF